MSNHPSLRNLPAVHELLEKPPLRQWVDRMQRNVLVSRVRAFLDNVRHEVMATTAEMKIPTAAELAERISAWMSVEEVPRLRPVINATGILLHTGLGRAPLSASALRELNAIAGGYCSLEVDCASGQRSQRVAGVESLLTDLTGAEAALVVNNNAAATVLALATLGAGREVIVSRGQLIEIGGSFRLPEIMQASGCRLREVGTTNKTHLDDYARAIQADTAALLRVHTSNYVVMGFSEGVPLNELVRLGQQHQLPVIDDIGSGALSDFSPYGLADEPMVRHSVQAGAAVVLFSGDKLLGGPQCGIIVGRKDLVQKMSNHPLMRAMRVDKLTLAALAATLRSYRDGSAPEEVPLWILLTTAPENLQFRAEHLAPQLASSPLVAQAEAVAGSAYLGGGSVPTQQIPTWCVAITPAGMTVDHLAARLRGGEPSIWGRIQQDRLWIDLRTVFPHQDSQIVSAFESLEDRTE